MYRLRILALLLLVFAASVIAADGRAGAQDRVQDRVAVAIGYGAYRNVPVLADPPSDATDIASPIGRLGQFVQRVIDAQMPDAGGAQRAALYEEDNSNPKGVRVAGSAVWRTEGAKADIAVLADIDVPERRLQVSWVLRRNADSALPASHTIEVRFTLPADFPHASPANPLDAITNMPGMLVKQTERARGVPLVGLTVKVASNSFLVGLSNVPTDVQKNVQLIKEAQWIDIPIIFTDGKRAILAVEIGTTGAKALAIGFAKWEQAER